MCFNHVLRFKMLCLTAVLLLAGGFTRSGARWISIRWEVDDFWLPFITGLVFVIPLTLLVYLLEKLPAPDLNDIRQRSERTPVDDQNRKAFVNYFRFGLLAVAVTYFVLTILRDIRDNYMSNIWDELGYADDYSIFRRTESLIAVVILLLLSGMVLIKKNFRAFSVSHVIITTGLLISGTSSLLFSRQIITGALWMQLTGLGLYLGYILFNCIFLKG